MPFTSEKQRRYMHANHPDIAERWEQKYHGKMKAKQKPKLGVVNGEHGPRLFARRSLFELGDPNEGRAELLEPGGHVSATRPAGSEPVSPPAAKMVVRDIARNLKGDGKGNGVSDHNGDLPLNSEDLSAKASGAFIGPKGGKWADAAHTVPWKESVHGEKGQRVAKRRANNHAAVMDGTARHNRTTLTDALMHAEQHGLHEDKKIIGKHAMKHHARNRSPSQVMHKLAHRAGLDEDERQHIYGQWTGNRVMDKLPADKKALEKRRANIPKGTASSDHDLRTYAGHTDKGLAEAVHTVHKNAPNSSYSRAAQAVYAHRHGAAALKEHMGKLDAKKSFAVPVHPCKVRVSSFATPTELLQKANMSRLAQVTPIGGASPREETPAMPDFQEIYYQPETDSKKELEREQAVTRRLADSARNTARFGFHGIAPQADPQIRWEPDENPVEHAGPALAQREPTVRADVDQDRIYAGTEMDPSVDEDEAEDDEDDEDSQGKARRGRVDRKRGH